MARKDLLKSLLAEPAAAAEPAKMAAPAPRLNKGAIGAVGQSIADLKSRSVLEIAPELIESAGLEDRLDFDPEGISALAESMRVYGQQVPILVRHSPKTEGRYEVVYGRRRLAALTQLGLPVKAMLRDLTDQDLMIAQGQENTLRKDLSFIEKANFARQMRENGFERAVICDALGVDKTVISRMLTVVDAIPLPLLHAIGAAPSIGRDRWLSFIERLKDHESDALIPIAQGAESDLRFEAVFAHMEKPKAKTAAPAPAKAPVALHGAGSKPLGEVKQSGQKTVLTLNRKDSAGFDDWLLARIESLHQEFLSQDNPRDGE